MRFNEQIQVRLKKDHSKVREMTARAFEVNQDKWELVPAPEAEQDRSQMAVQAALKKKVAVAAVTADSDYRIGGGARIDDVVQTTDEHKTEFVDITEQSLDDFKAILEMPNVKSSIESLREQYELQSGKPADKRWKAARIKSEIEKLTQQ